MNKQLKNGNRDERQLCSLFQEHHYWAYNCPKDSSGSQPIDVIAIKGTANTGTSSDTSNFCTLNLRINAPINSVPGNKSFKVRLTGYYT
jgi:hypothetical protein